MGLWQVDADTLAGSRFVISPLAEATACLMALDRGTAAHQGEREWLQAHRPGYRAQLADSTVLTTLVNAALGRRWIADFLTPTPSGERDLSFADELTAVRGAPPLSAQADLEVSLRGPLPAGLRRDDLPELMADLLAWVWTQTVLPYWPRRRRLLEADVLARTARLGIAGWAAALDTMRPGMRWLGDGRLQINALDYPPRRVFGAKLFFVPVSVRHSWISYDGTDRHAVVYPCAGVLSEPDRASVPASLSRLLGPARGGVLVLLDAPKSTTQLVAMTGQRLGSVGGHLKVLLDSGLVGRRRAGRSVLYYRTAAGEVLVNAGEISADPYPGTQP
jgi:DNA-binding transcriptional ArsR family regulator